jgi:hypothetical protein
MFPSKETTGRFMTKSILCPGARMGIFQHPVKSLCSDDKKFGTERRVCLLKAAPSYEVIKLPSSLNVAAEEGLKSLLTRLVRFPPKFGPLVKVESASLNR